MPEATQLVRSSNARIQTQAHKDSATKPTHVFRHGAVLGWWGSRSSHRACGSPAERGEKLTSLGLWGGGPGDGGGGGQVLVVQTDSHHSGGCPVRNSWGHGPGRWASAIQSLGSWEDPGQVVCVGCLAGMQSRTSSRGSVLGRDARRKKPYLI